MVRSGQINFTSIHGEMYLHASAVVTVINTVNVWEKVLNFLQGMVDRVTFATSRLTAQVPGRYLVQASISSKSAAVNQTLEMGIAKNGVVVDKTTIARRYGTTDIGASALQGLIDLEAGGYVELFVRNITTSGDVTISDCDFTMIRIK